MGTQKQKYTYHIHIHTHTHSFPQKLRKAYESPLGPKNNGIPDSLMSDLYFLSFFVNKTTPCLWNDSLLSQIHIHVHISISRSISLSLSTRLFIYLYISMYLSIYLVVGWGVDQGNKYWIGRNSWYDACFLFICSILHTNETHTKQERITSKTRNIHTHL